MENFEPIAIRVGNTEENARTRLMLARTLSCDERDLNVIPQKFLNMLKEGLIIKVGVQTWQATASLSFEDLGLPATELGVIARLGRRRLLPEPQMKKMLALSQALRATLYGSSYNTHWGYFVPTSRYQTWKQEHEAKLAEFQEFAYTLYLTYDQWTDQVLDEYRILASKAYQRFQVLRPDNWQPISEYQFTTNFIARIADQIPDRYKLQDMFQVQVDLSFLPIVATEATAALYTESSQAQIVLDMLTKSRQEKEAQVTAFVETVVSQLRRLVYDATTDVIDSIQKNKRMTGKSAVQLKNLCRKVKTLNFYDDKELADAIDHLNKLMEQPTQDRNMKEVAAQIETLHTLTSDTLLGLGQSLRSTRTVEMETDDTLDDTLRTLRGKRSTADNLDTTAQLDTSLWDKETTAPTRTTKRSKTHAL